MGSDVSVLLQADAPVPGTVLATQHEVHANPEITQEGTASATLSSKNPVVTRCPVVRIVTQERARQLLAGSASATASEAAAAQSARRTLPPPVLLVPDCAAPDAFAKSSTYVPLLHAIFEYMETHNNDVRASNAGGAGTPPPCPLGLDFNPCLNFGDRLGTDEARSQCTTYCKLFLTHLIAAVEHAAVGRATPTGRPAPSSAAKSATRATPAATARLYLLYVDARSCRLDDTTGLWFASTLIMRAVRRTRPYALVSARSAAGPPSPSSSRMSGGSAGGGADGFMAYFSPDVKADMMWATLQYVLLTHNNMSLQAVKAVLENLLAEDAMHDVRLQQQGMNPRAIKSQEVTAAVTQDRLFPRHSSQLLPQLYLVDVRHNLYDNQHVSEVLEKVMPASLHNAASPAAHTLPRPSAAAPAPAARTTPAVHPTPTAAGAAARAVAPQPRAALSHQDVSSDVPNSPSVGDVAEAEPTEHAAVPSVREQTPPLPPPPSRQREDQQRAGAAAGLADRAASHSLSPSQSQRPPSATPREAVSSLVTSSVPPSPQSAEGAPLPMPYVTPPTAPVDARADAAAAAAVDETASLESSVVFEEEPMPATPQQQPVEEEEVVAPSPVQCADVSLSASEGPRLSVASQDPEPRHGKPPTPNTAAAADAAAGAVDALQERRASAEQQPPPTPTPSVWRSPYSSVQRFVKLPGETSIGRWRKPSSRDDGEAAGLDPVSGPRTEDALPSVSLSSLAVSQSASVAAAKDSAAAAAAPEHHHHHHHRLDPPPPPVTASRRSSKVSAEQPPSPRQGTRATAPSAPGRKHVRSLQASPASGRGTQRSSTLKSPTASAEKVVPVEVAPNQVVATRKTRSRSPGTAVAGAPPAVGTTATPPAEATTHDAGADGKAAAARRRTPIEPQRTYVVPTSDHAAQQRRDASLVSRPSQARRPQPTPSPAKAPAAPRARRAVDNADDGKNDELDAAVDEVEVEVHNTVLQQRRQQQQQPSPPSGRPTQRHLVQSGRQHLPDHCADDEPWLDEVYPISHDDGASPPRSAGLAGSGVDYGSARGRRRYDIAALAPPEPFFAASAAHVPAVAVECGERKRHKSPAQVAASRSSRRRDGGGGGSGPTTSPRRGGRPSSAGGRRGGASVGDYRREARRGDDETPRAYVDTAPFVAREAQAKAEYEAATAAEELARVKQQCRAEALATKRGSGRGGIGGRRQGGEEDAGVRQTSYGASPHHRSQKPSTAMRATSNGSGCFAARRSGRDSTRLLLPSPSPAPHPPDTTSMSAISLVTGMLDAEEGSELAAVAGLQTSPKPTAATQQQRLAYEADQAERLYHAGNRQSRTTFRTAAVHARHAQPLEVAAVRQEQQVEYELYQHSRAFGGGVPLTTTMSSTSPLRRGDTAPQPRETAEARCGVHDVAVVAPASTTTASSCVEEGPMPVEYNENGVELIHSKLRTWGRSMC